MIYNNQIVEGERGPQDMNLMLGGSNFASALQSSSSSQVPLVHQYHDDSRDYFEVDALQPNHTIYPSTPPPAPPHHHHREGNMSLQLV